MYSDTVTRSGIFCAAVTIIEKCKSENIVDVFQVVKTQRINKPGSVPTPVSYELMYNSLYDIISIRDNLFPLTHVYI